MFSVKLFFIEVKFRDLLCSESIKTKKKFESCFAIPFVFSVTEMLKAVRAEVQLRNKPNSDPLYRSFKRSYSYENNFIRFQRSVFLHKL